MIRKQVSGDLMLRVEDKYSMPMTDFIALKERVSAVLEKDFYSRDSENGYKISSLYFDDLYDTCYNDTVAGNPIRRKYRIRIYNDSFDTIKLEVKTKQYNRITKSSCLISYDEYQKLINGETIEWGRTMEDPRTLFNEAISTRGLRPAVIVTYNREAFVVEQGNTRITFDQELRCSDHLESFGSADTVYDILDSGYILEVKYDEYIPDYLLQILEQNSMLRVAYSKYCNCRERYI